MSDNPESSGSDQQNTQIPQQSDIPSDSPPTTPPPQALPEEVKPIVFSEMYIRMKIPKHDFYTPSAKKKKKDE